MSETPTPDLTERAREEAYTPTTDTVRNAYCERSDGNFTADADAAFDRWLAAHDEQVRREAKAEAWDEGRESGICDVDTSGYGGVADRPNPYRDGGAR